ncbi:MAG: lysylphosphatidylglycerol synthase transmembrane domain-containing protein [Pirellulales bacterium]
MKHRSVRIAMQVVVLLLVVVGVIHSSRKAADDLHRRREELNQQATELERSATAAEDSAERAKLESEAARLRSHANDFFKASPVWLTAAALFYGVGMLVAGLYWYVCLRGLHQPAPLILTLWAYMLGQLGKYVPGKAMVLVLRVGTLAPTGVLKMATTLTIFMETLTMMAVGGAAAAIALICLQLDNRLTILAVGMLAGTLIPIFPPILRIVLKRLQRGVAPEKLNAMLIELNWRQFAIGIGMLSITWLCYGASLACVLYGCPTAEFSDAGSGTILLSALGACSLAVVVGFVSFLPGGAGVREVVLSTMLSPVVGPTAALAAAIWLRIVWLATELVMTGIVRLIRPAPHQFQTPESASPEITN